MGEIPFEAKGTFTVARTDGIGVRIREKPFQDGGRRGSVPEGAVVAGAEHAWRQIRTGNGVTGWVADTFLLAEGGRFRVVGTDGAGVRVRDEPFPGGNPCGAAAEGSLLSGVEDEAYREIRTDAGVIGWATAQYIDRVSANDSADTRREPLSDRQDGRHDSHQAEDQTDNRDSDMGGSLGGSTGEWTPALGGAIARENFWDANGQPIRRAAMERFNTLSPSRRRAIFDGAMDAGLSAEGITDPSQREHWKQAMRSVVVGDGFPGENPDLNPFMLAGEFPAASSEAGLTR